MKVFNHEKPGTAVSAPAGQLQLLLTLLQNNQLVEPERALRLAGAAIFAAFHNFSNQHIQEAVDEATKNGAVEATISAFKETKEEHEAALAKAEAENPVEPEPEPTPATPEIAPEPEAEPTKTDDPAN